MKLTDKEKSNLAKNPNTQPHVLELLAKDKDWSVRCRVAENLNTPTHVLEFLAKDEHWDVRYHVADNPNTPQHVLELLANDEDEWVRETALRRQHSESVTITIDKKDLETLTNILDKIKSQS